MKNILLSLCMLILISTGLRAQKLRNWTKISGQAEMTNPALEKKLTDLFNKTNPKSDKGISYKVFMLIIEDKEWRIQRDEGTGVVTGKILATEAACKLEDGNCAQDYIWFKQYFDGKSYGPIYVSEFGLQEGYVDCNTIPTKP
jgi:hypothetical protein